VKEEQMESAMAVCGTAEPLTESERSDLADCEQVINRGLQSFVEVGSALMKIRDERLYRQDYGTFEFYCDRRWGMSRVHAFRQIEAARVCRMLPDGNTPANEAQVRPLTKVRTEDGSLDGEAIVRLWRRVVDQVPEDKAGRKLIPAHMVEEVVRPTLQRRGVRFPRARRSRGSVVADPFESGADGQVATEGAGPKRNISDEQFAELHETVTDLAGLMARETLPQEVRTLIEQICWIVLD
jgi:hypothetical protein